MQQRGQLRSHWCVSNQEGSAQPVWDIVIHGMTQLWPQFSHLREEKGQHMFSIKTTSNRLEYHTEKRFECSQLGSVTPSIPAPSLCSLLLSSSHLFHFIPFQTAALPRIYYSAAFSRVIVPPLTPHSQEKEGESSLSCCLPTTLHSPGSLSVLPVCANSSCPSRSLWQCQVSWRDSGRNPSSSRWAPRSAVWHGVMAFLPFIPQDTKYISRNTVGLLL